MRVLYASYFIVAASVAHAQSLPPEGNIDATFTATNSNVLKPMSIGEGKDFTVINQSMIAVNAAGNPVLNNMGGRCALTRTSDGKSVDIRGWCTYADRDGDELFEKCDIVFPTSPKCTLSGGTGKFEGIQAELRITSTPMKGTYEGINQSIGTKKGSYKIVKTTH